jgi:hypothetical protein
MPDSNAVWFGFVKLTHSLSKVTHRLVWCGMRGGTPEKTDLKSIQHSTSNVQRPTAKGEKTHHEGHEEERGI